MESGYLSVTRLATNWLMRLLLHGRRTTSTKARNNTTRTDSLCEEILPSFHLLTRLLHHGKPSVRREALRLVDVMSGLREHHSL
jgi:hypothetical protein